MSTCGYEVHILNTVLSKSLQQADSDLIKTYPLICVQAVSDLTKNNLSAFIDRFFFKIGCLLVKYLKIETSLALGYGSFKYLRKCKAINADLSICHQELGTYVGTRLLKSGRKVAFDFEDWYSADLLPEARKVRPLNLLKRSEQFALINGSYSTTTSQALAKAMAKAYACAEPRVIYNTFPKKEELHKKEKTFSQPLKLFWFSQTIGPGRGLEEFAIQLKTIPFHVEFHLLGHIDEGYKRFILSIVPKQHSVHFHKLVAGPELAKIIANFDIGLALELTEPPSRNLTITNKLFQYLQSGLPVIATETAGQREIFEKFPLGFLIPKNRTLGDSRSLQTWLTDSAELNSSRKMAIAAAQVYCWENDSKKLLELVKDAICCEN